MPLLPTHNLRNASRSLNGLNCRERMKASIPMGNALPYSRNAQPMALRAFRSCPSRGSRSSIVSGTLAKHPLTINMAVAISGTVFLVQNCGRVKYRQKHERCGHSPSTVGTPTGANMLTTTFKRTEFGNQQHIEITGR